MTYNVFGGTLNLAQLNSYGRSKYSGEFYYTMQVGLIYLDHRHIKYSLDFLRPIKTGDAFEAVDWLADLPQRIWPQAGR